MVSWTKGDVGITLKLFAASVAEFFGLLLDMGNRRLRHARNLVSARSLGRRRLDRIQAHSCDDWLGKVVVCKKIASEKK